MPPLSYKEHMKDQNGSDRLKKYSILMTIIAGVFLLIIVFLAVNGCQDNAENGDMLSSPQTDAASVNEQTGTDHFDIDTSTEDMTAGTRTDDEAYTEAEIRAGEKSYIETETRTGEKSYTETETRTYDNTYTGAAARGENMSYDSISVGDITKDTDEESAAYYVAQGWFNMIKKANIDADIVFFGDSLIQRSDFAKYFPEKSIINLGLGGSTICGASQRVGMIPELSPEKIFVMVGVNVLRDDTADTCLEEYAALIDNIKYAMPQAEIYIHSILPISQGYRDGLPCSAQTTESFNSALRELSDQKGVTFIDIYGLFESDGCLIESLSDDGVHINSAGYDIWAEAIKEYIYE